MAVPEARVHEDRFLRYTAAVWGGVWCAAIAVTLSSEPAVVRLHAMAWVLLGAQFIALLTLPWFANFTRYPVMALLTFAALCNALNVNLAMGPSAQLLTTTWLNTATIVIAFVSTTRRRAALWITSAALLSGGLLLRNALQHETSSLTHLVLLPIAYALAVGLAATEAAAAIRSAGANARTDAAHAAAGERTAAAARARREAARWLGRLLHDTVINTLGAIRRGVSPTSMAATRARCADNLSALQASASPAPRHHDTSVTALREIIRADAHILELQLLLQDDSDGSTELELQMFEVTRSAVRELLTNVAKHSGVQQVVVDITLRSELLQISVIDAGRGIPSTETSRRGLRSSVEEPCLAFGGAVTHIPTPTGTHIVTTWPLRSEPKPTHTRVEHPLARANIRTIAKNTARWMLGLAILEALLFTDPQRAWGSAVAVFVLLAGVVWAWGRHAQSMSAVAAMTMGVAIAVVIALPNIALGSCRVDLAESWGVDGAAGLVVLLCMLGPSRLAPAVAVIGTVAGLVLPSLLTSGDAGSCASGISAVLPIELGTVVAVTAFRHLLQLLWRQTQASQSALLAAERRTAADDAGAQLRATRLRTVTNAIEPLLRGIAEGSCDPSDPMVMSAAARGETALRSLLLLDDSLGELGAILGAAVTSAFSCGAAVRVVSGEYVPDPEPAGCRAIARMLNDVVGVLEVGDTLDLGLFTRGSRCVLTAVTSAGVPDAGTHDAESVSIVIHSLETESLVEVSWNR